MTPEEQLKHLLQDCFNKVSTDEKINSLWLEVNQHGKFTYKCFTTSLHIVSAPSIEALNVKLVGLADKQKELQEQIDNLNKKLLELAF